MITSYKTSHQTRIYKITPTAKIANFLPPYHHFFRHFFYFAPLCKKNCQKIGRMTLFNIANQKKQRIFIPAEILICRYQNSTT
jgi:hypothetical protein